MERMTRFRARILLILFLVALGFYALKLYDLQIIQTDGNTDNTSTFTSVTRVKAARGDILDRNGNVLVSNRASYDLVLIHTVLLNAIGTNDYLYQLVKTCQENGIEYTEHFPISKERPFTYTLDQYSSAWQGYFQDFLAYKKGLDSDITAPLLIENLRTKYKIPAEWTDEEARLVIGLRYEMDLRGCTYLPAYLFLEDASDEELSAIVELNIPGMNVEASTVREYHTTYAAHILGHVGAMDSKQWEYYKTLKDEEGNLLYKMDAEVGQSGLESVYEEFLHGVDGEREDTVTTDGTLVRSVYTVEPQAGDNVSLSIDINLQMAAEDRLAQVIEDLRAQEEGEDGADAGGGAVVAMDVKTGQVLVCASYPTYDLSSYFEDFEENNANPDKPFYNRALLATYPPGSTYKMSMVIAAIDNGFLRSSETIYDEGIFTKYGEGFSPTCLTYSMSRTTHGHIDATVALQKSCNYFFYELADRMTLSAIDSTAKGLGLGESTGIELSENIGHRANAETKKKLYGKGKDGWYPADQVLASIGQSDNLFSPMQLCVYASTLANQGTRYKATFLNRVVSSDYRSLSLESDASIASHFEISNTAYVTMLEGMKKVAHESGGTAYKTFSNYPISIAAKTGTAQTGITGTSDHGAFVCFAPANDPQIAISVYIERGGHGSTLATVAEAILDVYFDVDEVGDVITYENGLS